MVRAVGTTVSDLIGKLNVIVVEGPKCECASRHALRRLIEQHGRTPEKPPRDPGPAVAQGAPGYSGFPSTSDFFDRDKACPGLR